MHVGADPIPAGNYPVRVQPLMLSGKFQNAGSVFSAYLHIVPSVFATSVMATCLVDCLPILNSWYRVLQNPCNRS